MKLNRSDDDQQLVLRAIDGDTRAFDTLVARHSGLVLRIARRLTRGIDDAEDVAQQAFLKAFTRLSTCRFQSSFRTWLIAIVANQARMWNRQVRRYREAAIINANSESNLRIQFDLPDPCANPEVQYSDKEQMRILMAEINRLAPATRNAICACDLEEVSVIDTAVLLGVTASSLKSRRNRARSVLRQKLARRLALCPFRRVTTFDGLADRHASSAFDLSSGRTR
jgi:RNA polymerase sigma-70 factor, ECF subfamily